MKERPILFNSEMVRAILHGPKTMTRRPVPERIMEKYDDYDEWCQSVMIPSSECSQVREYEKDFYENRAPWQVGDVLWVRETFSIKRETMRQYEHYMPETFIEYKADGAQKSAQFLDPEIFENVRILCEQHDDWRPSIHMPRWASRIKLSVKRVWVERVQDIDSDGALAEGVSQSSAWTPKEVDENPKFSHEWAEPYYDDFYFWCNYPQRAFGKLWQSIYKNWDANPWVWCVEFERIEK